jgi:cytochrome P450
VNFEFSPFDRVFTNNPYPFYAEMRADHPVHHWVRSDIWTICTYDAVSAALRNVKAFSSRAMAEILMGKMPGERGSANSTRRSFAVVYADPPVHTALRKIANRGFMPDMMKALEGTAEIAVDEMLARVKHRDSFDVIEDFGLELPIRMIAALLGVEAHNYSDMRKAADAVVQGMNGSKRHLGPEASGLNDGNRALKRIIRESVKARIANPDVGLISRLLSASEDGALTPDEVVGTCSFLRVRRRRRT